MANRGPKRAKRSPKQAKRDPKRAKMGPHSVLSEGWLSGPRRALKMGSEGPWTWNMRGFSQALVWRQLWLLRGPSLPICDILPLQFLTSLAIPESWFRYSGFLKRPEILETVYRCKSSTLPTNPWIFTAHSLLLLLLIFLLLLLLLLLPSVEDPDDLGLGLEPPGEREEGGQQGKEEIITR